MVGTALIDTNPLQDLGRLLTRPLSFAAELASDQSVVSNWALSKAVGFYVFAVALLSIASLVPRAEVTAETLDVLVESLRPLLDTLAVSSSDVAALESLIFFGTRMTTELMVFTGILQSLCALLLLSSILSLVWPALGFRRILCWTAYAHWFVLLGLLVPSPWLLGLLAALFLARITLEAEGHLGFGRLFLRGGMIGLLGTLISFLGLTLV